MNACRFRSIWSNHQGFIKPFVFSPPHRIAPDFIHALSGFDIERRAELIRQ